MLLFKTYFLLLLSNFFATSPGYIWIRNIGCLICHFCVKVPGVDVVLQQEADLRNLQQQFRPVPQQQRLAPWEQPRLLQEQQSSQKLAPWEVAEQRRLLQEQQRLRPDQQQQTYEKLAPWEVEEQRRLLQEQQRPRPDQQSNEKLAPWEVAEQRRVQQEQLRLQQEEQQRLQAMDQITIKTPNSKCRLY